MVTSMTGRPLAEQPAYAIATIAQRRQALATTLGVLLVAIMAVPYGERSIGAIDGLLPAIGSGSMVAMVVSGVLLANQYHSTRYVPYAVLSVAYWTTAILLAPYMLFSAHAFSLGAFGMGTQVAPWLWIVWHATFVLLVAGYVWSDSYFARHEIDRMDGAEFVRRYALTAGVFVAGGVAAVLLFAHKLPILIADGTYTLTYHLLVQQLLLTSACIVMATMIARNALRNPTNLWVCVVLAAYTIEIFLNGDVISAPYLVAWYAGLFCAAAWQSVFLFVQLHHANQQLAAYAADTRTLVEETQRDALTNLFNRRGFDDHFELALAESKAARASVALLALDLDHFKAYNDHFGHLAGDDALRQISAAMMGAVNRPADACCRVGGEEFAIILSETDESGAQIVAERVRLAVMRLRIKHAPEIQLPCMTISVGVAVTDAAASITAKALHDRADKALYRAKRLGRNCVVVADGARDSGGLRVV
jgi:diguanylate cyclase (GGDEF)-like protein